MNFSTRNTPGTVYLIHFDRPYKHARHYTGWTQDLEKRISEHERGINGKLMSVINTAGITWQIARIWRNRTRKFETQVKHTRKATLCPICQGLHVDSLI